MRRFSPRLFALRIALGAAAVLAAHARAGEAPTEEHERPRRSRDGGVR